jgi:hypothetical protein
MRMMNAMAAAVHYKNVKKNYTVDKDFMGKEF